MDVLLIKGVEWDRYAASFCPQKDDHSPLFCPSCLEASEIFIRAIETVCPKAYCLHPGLACIPLSWCDSTEESLLKYHENIGSAVVRSCELSCDFSLAFLAQESTFCVRVSNEDIFLERMWAFPDSGELEECHRIANAQVHAWLNLIPTALFPEFTLANVTHLRCEMSFYHKLTGSNGVTTLKV